MDNLIKTENLSFSYKSDEKLFSVFKDLNIEIERGSFVAVLGHNGSGKSTFAKHLNGILLPSDGTVLVDGINTVDEETIFDVRQRVGLVFQNPDNQIVATIVEEDVAFALENLGVPPAEIRARVDKALKQVSMYEHRLKAPHNLSGGQKQRVAIAGILAMEPVCIVLDEPTAMLDPKGRDQVLETIKTLNKERGVTIILITHYMEEATAADRVIVMDKGKVTLDGTPSEVFCRRDEIERAGLKLPSVSSLALHLIKRGVDLPTDILTAEEFVDAFVKVATTGE